MDGGTTRSGIVKIQLYNKLQVQHKREGIWFLNNTHSLTFDLTTCTKIILATPVLTPTALQMRVCPRQNIKVAGIHCSWSKFIDNGFVQVLNTCQCTCTVRAPIQCSIVILKLVEMGSSSAKLVAFHEAVIEVSSTL